MTHTQRLTGWKQHQTHADTAGNEHVRKMMYGVVDGVFNSSDRTVGYWGTAVLDGCYNTAFQRLFQSSVTSLGLCFIRSAGSPCFPNTAQTQFHLQLLRCLGPGCNQKRKEPTDLRCAASLHPPNFTCFHFTDTSMQQSWDQKTCWPTQIQWDLWRAFWPQGRWDCKECDTLKRWEVAGRPLASLPSDLVDQNCLHMLKLIFKWTNMILWSNMIWEGPTFFTRHNSTGFL